MIWIFRIKFRNTQFLNKLRLFNRSLLSSVVFCIFILSTTQNQARGSSPEVVPGEFIVKYKVSNRSSVVSSKMAGKAQLKQSFPALKLYHIVVPEGVDQAVNLEKIKQDSEVEYIEPNYIVHVSDDGIVNEVTSKITSEDLKSSASTYSAKSYSQSMTPVKVTESWDLLSPVNVSGKTVVAVIDTGVDLNHTVFKSFNQGGSGALWVNSGEVPNNGIDDDGNGYVDDVNGWNFFANTSNPNDDESHGTHVAGIIVGTGIDILNHGVLEESKIEIMPLKFLGSDGSGSTSNAISAIYYAVKNGAKIINNSWGGSGYSKSLHEAFTYAYNHQVLLVNAAGNYSKNNDLIDMYPANLDIPGSIAVAAVGNYDTLASFSNYGNTRVEIAAPGVNVLSTLPGDSFGTMSGTSMAAPFVSGIAALVSREAPYLTGFQIKELLKSTSNSIDGLSGKINSAHRINAYSAISEAKLQLNSSSYQPTYSPAYGSRSPASESSSSSSSGGGCGTISTLSLSHRFGQEVNPNLPSPLLVLIFSLPLFLWIILKQKSVISRRQHERFSLDSEIKIKVGGRELIGSTRTISMGGVSFDANQALEKGGMITMKISSPDGSESIEVQGEVIWNQENHSYGVRFAEQKSGVVSVIQNWISKLHPAK